MDWEVRISRCEQKDSSDSHCVLFLGIATLYFFSKCSAQRYGAVSAITPRKPKWNTKQTVPAMIRASAGFMDLSNSFGTDVPAYPSIGVTDFRFFLPPNPPSVG